MPAHNSAEFLGQTLDSVFAQSVTDLEVIVVDDGSTDATRDVATAYGERVRYVYQANQGAGPARNVALRLARGEYLAFLDSDDLWEPDHLRVKLAVLRQFPQLGGVFGEFAIFDASGVLYPRGTKALFPVFDRLGCEIADMFKERRELDIDGRARPVYLGNIFESLFLGNFILPTSALVNRAHAATIGEFCQLRTQQDYEYWLRFASRYPFAFLDEVHVRYRRHPAQLTNFGRIERIMLAVNEIVDGYEAHFAHIGRRNVYDRRKAELLTSLGKIYVRQGKNREARGAIAAAIRRRPGYAAAYLHYALSFLRYSWLASARNAWAAATGSRRVGTDQQAGR